MDLQDILEVKEVQSYHDANKLLSQGWKLINVFCIYGRPEFFHSDMTSQVVYVVGRAEANTE